MTKAYIVPTLRTDLISVKSLISQGYRVICDADPEESVNNDFFRHQSYLLKDILIQLLSWIVTQDIDGCMACRPRMVCCKLSGNGIEIYSSET